jgi:hypothetical protein
VFHVKQGHRPVLSHRPILNRKFSSSQQSGAPGSDQGRKLPDLEKWHRPGGSIGTP